MFSYKSPTLLYHFFTIYNNQKKKTNKRLKFQMVGMTGFEPATTWSQTKCSTKLSHIPKMVRSEGFEPPTFWFVAKHSIQLSYERMTHVPKRTH